MRRRIFDKPLGIVLLSLTAAAVMWIYAGRVLIPHQKSDAILRRQPRGNLSDLYPRWLGARELLLHGRDPYSAEVTREIQIGFYGRPLDRSRPEEPGDQQGFAYPVYVVFCLAPIVGLPFAAVQEGSYWLLLLLTWTSILLWLRLVRRSAPLWIKVSLIALAMGSPAVMQALKLRQLTLLVASLLAIAMTLLVEDHQISAGFLLALATIKPQLALFLLGWLAVWVLADWRRRYRIAISFLVTMTIFVAASEWYLSHWISRFWHAIRDYQRYTGAMSVMDNLIGTPGSRVVELLATVAVIGVCWRERRAPAGSASFIFVTALVLATTILIVPTSANYNQVLIIPGLLVLGAHRGQIWRRGIGGRALLIITAVLVGWPWVSSAALAMLSYVMQREKVEAAWALPFWTVIQIPVAVTALMLIQYYQQTFTAQAKAGAS